MSLLPLVAYVVPSPLSVVSGQLQPTADYTAGEGPGQRTTDNGQLTTELRQFLRDRLPDYMVPSAFVLLDALPLTPNGKVDRQALPAPDTRCGVEQYEPPRSATEQLLARLWSDVLHVERVGLHDNFFELGGTSMSIVTLHHRIDGHLPGRLSLIDLFQHPTVARQARHVVTNVDVEDGAWRGQARGRARRGNALAVHRRQMPP